MKRERATTERHHSSETRMMIGLHERFRAGNVTCRRCRARATCAHTDADGLPVPLCSTCSENRNLDKSLARLREFAPPRSHRS